MKSKKVFNFGGSSLALMILTVLTSLTAWGATSSSVSGFTMGTAANNVFEAGMSVKEIINAVCIVAGSGLILSSLLQYKKHRQNPVETTWGTVIFTFMTGIAIICLSFVPISL